MDLIYAWDIPGFYGSPGVDDPDVGSAHIFRSEIVPGVDQVKIGKQLFTAEGPRAVRYVHTHGGKVFLDLKYCDIPNTVAGAVKAACDHGVAMVNVHAMGGRKMMEAAATAAEGYDTKIIAVTLLTSLDYDALEDLGLVHPGATALGDGVRSLTGLSPEAGLVRRLTRVALDSGLDGVVCSAQEAAAVREVKTILDHPDFLVVCPGIRPTWAQAKDDQKRTATPTDAVDAGATHIVVGRPISNPPGNYLLIPSGTTFPATPSGFSATPSGAIAAIRHEIYDAEAHATIRRSAVLDDLANPSRQEPS